MYSTYPTISKTAKPAATVRVGTAPTYDELVTTLRLIEHATAPTHDDGAYHEAAHDLASQMLQRLATVPAPAVVDGAAIEEARRQLLNTPELRNFSEGVTLEALHQRERWGTEHDAGKTPADWFWLVGYLAGKALHAQTSGNTEKALHHTISTAAALANWHAAISGALTAMRPGIDPAAHGVAESNVPVQGTEGA